MLLGGSVSRKLDLERGAMSRGGLSVDASAMGFDDRSGDRESETGTPRTPASAAVDAVKALEDSVELVGRDSRPGVAHRDVELTVVRPRADRDPVAVPGVGDGVADEVVEHLSESVRISLEGAVDGVELKLALAE